MLNMLCVMADAPAVIMLNGQPAGELSGNVLWMPAGDGAVIFQAFPMERGLLPITAKICLAGEDSSCIGPAMLYLLPKDRIGIRLNFERIPQESEMPYILRRVSLGAEQYAAVYFDRVFSLAIERSGRVILSAVFRHKLSDASIERMGNTILFRGKHSEGTELFVVSADNRVLLHCDCADVTVNEQAVEYSRVKDDGIFQRERLSLRDGRITSGRIFCAKKDAETLLRALAAAVKEGAEESAMALIHPSLKREADFSAFSEFMGDFCDIYSAEMHETVGLCYALRENVFRVRLLRAAVKEDLIANIEETEE